MKSTIQGMTVQKNKNGFVAVRLHYTAVPKFRSPEWKQAAMKGYSQDRWEQEMEINFTLAGTSKVFPMFNYETHVKKLSAIKELPLLIGWDFGYHHPAIVVAQIDSYDTFCILDAILGHDITVKSFGLEIKKFLQQKYSYFLRNKKIQHFGDPAGNQKNDKSEYTSIQILRKLGFFIKWKRAPIKQGIRIMQQLMEKRDDGSVGFKVDPKCKIIIDAMRGGYVEDSPSNEKQSNELPFTDDYYSHNIDATRYIIINKFPAHGILYKHNNRTELQEQYSPLSDDEKLTHIQSKITGY